MSNFSVVAPGQSYKNLAHIAKTFRDKILSSEDCKVPVIKILESIMPVAFGCDYRYLPSSKMTEEGKTLLDGSMILIREDVYEGAIEGNGRDRFTIAHEIGHRILHCNKLKKFSLNRKELSEIKTYEDPEWQANTFAGFFLVPPKQAMEINNAEEIERKFSVSQQCANIIIKNSAKI